ncbi:MAG: DUF1449 family protein [Planctomycetales bacterium]|nr:DUF1449 family protein [Planctomycetales bacterium]
MNEFYEFLRVCFIAVNVPFTVMLGAVFIYWIMFIVGAVGLDSFDIDMDMDLDTDLDLDLDVDVDADLDLDVDADIDVDANADVSAGGGTGGGSIWISLLRFFNVGDVPLMILVSTLTFSCWSLGIMSNHYFNPELSTTRSLLLLTPILVLGLLATKVLTAPVRTLFKHVNAGTELPIQMVGKTCIVTTGEVTPTFGQAKLVRDGPPVTINVRCGADCTLKKGDEAVIAEHNKDKNTYTVVPFNLEMK